MSDDYNSSSSSDADRPVRVLKFGGTSVGTPEPLQRVVRIVRRAAETCRPVVVVSAAAGVTDRLVRAADAAPLAPSAAGQRADAVGACYSELVEATLSDETIRARYASLLRARCSVLRRALTGRVPKGTAARDAVLAVGERLMVPLVVGLLVEAGHRAQAVDATAVIRTDAAHGAATVEGATTRAHLRAWQARDAGPIPVVTGFLGSTADGVTTTLGRGGSDYSAALLAQGLGAERMERWTDVDGLYTHDPEQHDEARRLAEIPMETARGWAKEGRLGLHARTLDPLAAADIPLHVRCTSRPSASGTRVVPTPAKALC